MIPRLEADYFGLSQLPCIPEVSPRHKTIIKHVPAQIPSQHTDISDF